MECSHQNADDIVWAVCVLHNFLKAEMREGTDEDQLLPAFRRWRGLEAEALENEEPRNAKEIRNNLVAYFNSVGSLDFQENMI